MRAVRSWVSGIILVSGVVATATTGHGTTLGRSTHSPEQRPPAARVDELEQQIRVLKRLRELAGGQHRRRGEEPGQSVTANGKDGFSLKSADGKYVLKLRGYAQADGRFYRRRRCQGRPNTFFLRRARPIVEPRSGSTSVPHHARLRPGPDGALRRLRRRHLTPAFAFRLGKFKPPVGLERLQSATRLVFAERGCPTNLVPNRDIGLQSAGTSTVVVLNYAVGVFDGVPTSATATAT